MTYFRTGNPYYHRRATVSRSCSGWEGVGPAGCGRQALIGGRQSTAIGCHPCRPIEEEVKLGLDRRKHRNQLHAVHMVMGSSRTGY